MLISDLTIHNYRSIRELSIKCSSLVTLLGPNNHGKSNVLSALEFGLSTSAKPSDEDYFVHRESEDDDLWVQITFGELTEQERNTFSRYVLFDNSICIRKTARRQEGSIEISYNGWIEEPQEEWLRNENAGNYTNREKINSTPLKDRVPQKGRLKKADVEEAQGNYILENQESLQFSKKLETAPFLGTKNVAGGVLPEFYLIPAVRDLTDEMKIRTNTAFGRLMNRAVQEMAERDPQFSEAMTQLEMVVASLNHRDPSGRATSEIGVLEENIENALQGWGVNVNIEVERPELEKLFELGTNIHLDDGVRTTADKKGHGLQRAMIFALLRSWATALRVDTSQEDDEGVRPRRPSTSVVFAMEEPELFLHPQAQRRLSASLRQIAETPEHQVFLCTHSPHFVDLAHYKEIAIISKSDPVRGSEVRQCREELFAGENTAEKKKRFQMAEWINPDRGEIFFAERVIFVEGETERVAFPYVAEKLGVVNLDISIVDCGSKHNLPLYITIAKAFKIPYVVIYDEDPLPDPVPTHWSAEQMRSKRKTYSLGKEISKMVQEPLGSVEAFSPDFEGASGVPKAQAKKKGKALAALEHFSQLSAADLPDAFVSTVKAAYHRPSKSNSETAKHSLLEL